MTEARYPELQAFERVQRAALVVGGLGLVLSLVGLFLSPEAFFRGLLLGVLFWTGVAVGCLALMMLHRLTGGAWGMVIRRTLEAAALTLPLLALFFLPIAFGLPFLYEWAHPEAVAEDPLLQHKQPYLNPLFFLLRAAIYFGIWSYLAYYLTSRSDEEDREYDPVLARRLRTVSAMGLLLLVLTITFSGYDWVMTLEPHWFSSIFGALVGSGWLLSAMAFVILAIAYLSRREPVSEVMTHALFNDLGSLLLAFVMIWAYMQLSQFLLIWAGNIPEEVEWYVHRTTGGWEWLSLALPILHFALPFVLLLARKVRRTPDRLIPLAIYLLLVHFLDLVWLVVPSFETEGFAFHWLDLVVPLGLGSFWVALFIWRLKRRPLLPLLEIPRLRERAERAYE